MSEWSYDLIRDGITQGALSTFLSCPRKAELKLKLGYGVPIFSEAIDFGNIVHANLELVYTWYRNWIAETGTYFKPDLNTILKTYQETLKRQELEGIKEARVQGDVDLLHKNYELANAVLDTYYRVWQSDFDTVHWLKLEEEFGYLTTVGREEVTLRGKIDGVFTDENNELMMFETKTKSVIDTWQIPAVLTFDRQISMYSMAIAQQYNRRISGVCYNLIKRPQQRLGKYENLDTFTTRVRAEVAKNPDEYFKRVIVHYTTEDLVSMHKDLRYDLNRFITWYHSDYSPRNSDSCHQVFRTCDYLQFCGNGDPSQLIARERHFSELDYIPVAKK